MKKNKQLMGMERLVRTEYGQEGDAIAAGLHREFESLCAAHPDQPKAVRQHTVMKLYPAIALYRALQSGGKSQQEAFDLVSRFVWEDAEQSAASMRKLMKLPGVYKTMPFFWKIVTKSTFGEAAGFQFHFYDTGSDRVKFDMVECTYCKVCRAEGCPELISIFCHTDDINNENLHPRLLWNRTKTMGGGDDLCDFDLIVLPKDQ